MVSSHSFIFRRSPCASGEALARFFRFGAVSVLVFLRFPLVLPDFLLILVVLSASSSSKKRVSAVLGCSTKCSLNSLGPSCTTKLPVSLPYFWECSVR